MKYMWDNGPATSIGDESLNVVAQYCNDIG